jgi:hypothetical protein
VVNVSAMVSELSDYCSNPYAIVFDNVQQLAALNG